MVLVVGEELSRAPYNSTPPATWAANAAGTNKYDRTPERPIKRRRCISDSTEEVGPLRGIRDTNPCQASNPLRVNSLGLLGLSRKHPIVTILGQKFRSKGTIPNDRVRRKGPIGSAAIAYARSPNAKN